MRLEIAGFQSPETELEHRMATREDHIHTVLDKDQELLFLHSKLIGMEDRSWRDNIRLFGFPEHTESTDTPLLPLLRPPKIDRNSFRTAFGVPESTSSGPKEERWNLQTPPITACLLRHKQVRQLLSASQAHRPFKTDGYEIRITADFSKETNERHKGFLVLRTRMRQLELKYGLFEPTRQ
ncbi:hypothetical protein NDU88_001989 [Pleurodeles waltl]|uniref:Uncharacterized protein n=1 Tax=Pleurodeles waltl TaxID=8319 RepID=A0AAV7LEP8_PLEWA|nr:hypothetical protein NDU88_001989 [Pleurodeles waltl]